MLKDLDDTAYTLTEHLGELRGRLFKGLLAVLVTSGACLAFAPTILDYATEPLRATLRDGNRVETLIVHQQPEGRAALERTLAGLDRARIRGADATLKEAVSLVRSAASSRYPIDLLLVTAESIGADGAYVSDLLEGVEPAPYVVYLVADPEAPAVRELQLDGATVVLEPVRVPVMRRLVRRAAGAAGKASNPDRLVVLSPLEVFFAYLKIAIVFGLFLACPIWLYQAWAFVAPGLYAHEKRLVLPVVLSASLLFVSGGLFAYYVMFPVMFDFLVNQMLPQTLTASFTVENYIGLLLRLTVAFGVVFELPLVIALLAYVGIVDVPMLSRMRKYAVIFAFVLGAFLTPADPMSQLLMAIPLVVFYEVGIIVARVVGKKRKSPSAGALAERE